MAEFTVTGMEEANTYMVITGSGSELHDLRHMEEVARQGKYSVQIDNVTDDLGVLSIAGPLSGHVLSKALKDQPLVDAWKFLDAKNCQIGDVDCLAVRISYTGELGWEFYMPINQMKSVYDSLMDSGREYGIGHFGTFTVNTFRMEKGFKMWGNEMNCDGTILEAGLEAFVRMKKKSDFLGKKVLQAKMNDYMEQKLTMLEVDVENVDPEGNESVWLCNSVIGNTTSGCYSPALGKGLAFAYIPALADVPGTELQVEIMGEMREARVLSGPPVLTQPVRDK